MEPLYMQIVATITARVQAGVLKPGERLPSGAALAAEFEVGLSTVRQALVLLRDRGVLVGQPGRGIFVAHSAHD